MRFPMRAEQREQQWPALNPSQADGTECVMCEVNYLHPSVRDLVVSHVPVGVSTETGSQVFACAGICAALAWPD
jgi:hypothetical protein